MPLLRGPRRCEAPCRVDNDYVCSLLADNRFTTAAMVKKIVSVATSSLAQGRWAAVSRLRQNVHPIDRCQKLATVQTIRFPARTVDEREGVSKARLVDMVAPTRACTDAFPPRTARQCSPISRLPKQSAPRISLAVLRTAAQDL